MSDKKSVNLRDLLNVYESNCVLPSGIGLKLKPITTAQLKSLLVHENENNPIVIEDALDTVISSSVIDEGFNIDELYLADRFDLMLEIRKITKGNNYTFNYKCERCGIESPIAKDLNTLPKKQKTVDEMTLKVNDRISLVIGFPTRGDQKRAYHYLNLYKDAKIDTTKLVDAATATMAYAIRKVLIDGIESEEYKGEEGMNDKIYILENVPRPVYTEMTDFFNNNKFGTDFEFNITCSCGKKVKCQIPLNDFFA